MIQGIGVDSVEIHRFALWYTFTQNKLLRLFSQQEINYCLEKPNKSAERFAARFAAREAFFKAFSAAYPTINIPFLTLCKLVYVDKENSRPVLVVDWYALAHISNYPTTHLSLTHTNNTATAFVIIE